MGDGQSKSREHLYQEYSQVGTSCDFRIVFGAQTLLELSDGRLVTNHSCFPLVCGLNTTSRM